nr:hydroxyacylglutathione hydrolase-like protein isoform X1 [Vulpes vulpes]
MKVKVIPVLEDNYMYLVIEERTREAVAVDVAVPKRLLEIVGREGVSLTTVLTTHHHWDHARGNAELARLRPGLAVLGADERICALTRRLVHGEELRVSARPGGRGAGLAPPRLTAVRPSAAVRGHSRALPPNAGPHLRPHELLPVGRGVSGPACGVLWYRLPRPAAPLLRPSPSSSYLPCPPGDALSVAGCGLRLESTAQQMYESLTQILGTLPPDTKVFCGHEHTLGNLEFAQKVEPGNDHVRAKLSWAKKRDEDDMPTVPSTLSEELLYNPFLRVAEEPVRKFTGKAAPAEVLEALCKERASFQRAVEPLQPQARALLALQWGLLGTPQQK